MTDYKCGHKTDGILILDSSILSTSAYITWAYEDGGIFDGCKWCFDCWNKQRTKEMKGN